MHDEPHPGVRPIDTIQRGALWSAPSALAGLLAALVLSLAAAGVLAAAPAAAIDDPTLPDVRVTHAPSCRPGGLVVEVVAGTTPYAVRLATTRLPAGEDEALLQPGETAVLRTGDVAPGETIDGRLEFAAQDGSGATYVDELLDHTYTRPTVEDCEQATAPPPSTPPPSATPTPTPSATPTPTPTPAPSSPTGTPSSSSPRATPSPAPTPSATPTPTAPGSAAPVPSASQSRPPAPASRAGEAPAPVAVGGVVRVRVAGYQPGEQVTIALHGTGEVLGAATADDAGSIVAEVRIPPGTAVGPASLDVIGEAAAAVVPLDVAAAVSATAEPAPSLLPLLAAAGALAATGAGLLSLTSGRRSRRH